MQQSELPSFGALPEMDQYVRSRKGGTRFFVVDLALPSRFARLGVQRVYTGQTRTARSEGAR